MLTIPTAINASIIHVKPNSNCEAIDFSNIPCPTSACTCVPLLSEIKKFKNIFPKVVPKNLIPRTKCFICNLCIPKEKNCEKEYY